MKATMTRVTVFILILAFTVEAQQGPGYSAGIARLRTKFARGRAGRQTQQGNFIRRPRQQGNFIQRQQGNGNVNGRDPAALLLPLGLLAAAVVVPAGILLLSGFVNGGTAATSGVMTSLAGAMTGTGVTTSLTGGKRRRRREANQQDQQKLLQQMSILQSYLDNYGTGEVEEIHEEMVARYMECSRKHGGHEDMMSKFMECSRKCEEDVFLPCLEKLMCVFHDQTINMDKEEEEVASVVINSIMSNKYVDPLFKKALRLAGYTGYTYPGSCHKYTCKTRSQVDPNYTKP